MDWILVMWVVTGFGNAINQYPITTRLNSETACHAILDAGRRSGFRGVCVYDPPKGKE